MIFVLYRFGEDPESAAQAEHMRNAQMANRYDANTTAADYSHTTRPHAEDIESANSLNEQDLKEEREQQQNMSPGLDMPIKSRNSDHDDGKVTATEEEILAPRGFQRIIINFTPS